MLAIGYDSSVSFDTAKRIATQFNLPIDNTAPMQLLVMADKLALYMPPAKPIYVDFSEEEVNQRAQGELALVRACLAKKGCRIVDATAGFGRDASMLAKFGANVVMLERNPVVAMLLQDGLARLKAPWQLSLASTDAHDYLAICATQDASQRPHVVYLDPMHPARKKTARVKQALYGLQQLIPPNDDVASLISLARQCALKRVVVKWPEKEAPCVVPQGSIHGKTIRFDLYSPYQ